MKRSDRLFDLFVYIVLALVVIVTLYPMLYVAIASVSDGDRLLSFRGLLWRPLGFTLAAYQRAAANPSVWAGYANTLMLVGGGVLLNLSMTILGAYVLSRKKVPWSSVLMFAIVLTMFFDGGLIPFYLVVKGTGIMDTLWSLLLPFSIKTFHLIIMRTAFLSFPQSIEESAQIDGAGHWTLLAKIIVPLSMPVIAVIILYTAVDKWNLWFYASIFIQDRSRYPLQLVLREILIRNLTDNLSIGAGVGEARKLGETIKYATIMISTVPVLLIYPFLQKYFVKGVMVGAIKG